MASEIGLYRELWKYRSKKSLPQIAHLRCRKLRCIAIGNLTLVLLFFFFLARLQLSEHG
jgi:hypothetical protein